MGKKHHRSGSSSSSSSSSSSGGEYPYNQKKQYKRQMKYQKKMLKKNRCVCKYCPPGQLACGQNYMKKYTHGRNGYYPGNPMSGGVMSHGVHGMGPSAAMGSAMMQPPGGMYRVAPIPGTVPGVCVPPYGPGMYPQPQGGLPPPYTTGGMGMPNADPMMPPQPQAFGPGYPMNQPGMPGYPQNQPGMPEYPPRGY